jgi:hypothetical protein
MKSVLLLFFHLCSYLLTAQINTVATAINNTLLKKGFYKNYDEFITNSPSIIVDFNLKKTVLNKEDSTIICAEFEAVTKSTKLNNVWGFCDGKSVFVRYIPFKDKLRYYRVEDFGKYSTFTFIKKASGFSSIFEFLVYLVAPTKTVLLVIDENGKVKYPDYAFMSKVLKSMKI